MDQFASTTNLILSMVGTFSYLGLFVFFFGLGHFIPVPEEVAFLLVGYLAGENIFTLSGAIFVTILGIVAMNNLIYWLSRGRVGQWLRQKVDQTTLKRYTEAMHKHIFKTMVVLRFAIGLRFLSALVAGMTKVSWWRYFFYDLIIVSVYTTVLVNIGYRFHDFLALAIRNITFARHLIFVLILVFFGAFLTYEFSRYWCSRGGKNNPKDLLK